MTDEFDNAIDRVRAADNLRAPVATAGKSTRSIPESDDWAKAEALGQIYSLTGGGS